MMLELKFESEASSQNEIDEISQINKPQPIIVKKN